MASFLLINICSISPGIKSTDYIQDIINWKYLKENAIYLLQGGLILLMLSRQYFQAIVFILQFLFLNNRDVWQVK